MSKQKLKLAVRLLEAVQDYQTYKKEHPGTKKGPSDPLFKNVSVYDNGGKSADRYTVVHHDKSDDTKHFYGMSEKPHDPQGFNQYLGSHHEGYQEGSHLGKKLKEVPKHLHKAIKERIQDPSESDIVRKQTPGLWDHHDGPPAGVKPLKKK